MRERTTVSAFRAGAVVSVRDLLRGVRQALPRLYQVVAGRAVAPLAVALFAVGACSTNGTADGPSDDRTDIAEEGAAVDIVSIEDALAEHTEDWMEVDGVEGTGIGLCADVPCIKIFVSRPPAEFADALPESVHGHPIRLEPTGRFEAQ